MTHFMKNGNQFHVAPDEAIDIRESLPVGTYTVKYIEMKDTYYLEQVEDFTYGGKLYGDTAKTTERILRTFGSRTQSTGVLLSGEKGSGKTLQAKQLSITAATHGMPTIIINQPWGGDTFNTFMQMIDQPTVVLLDEFEKVYNAEAQEGMLTLLDGVYASKKLFVLTTNDPYRINQYMSNRPGRIFYRIDYKGLEPDFIREYCEDNLDDKEQIDSIVRLSVLFSAFNFDMLKAVVEEMNRYEETAQQVISLLNVKPEQNYKEQYTATLTLKGQDSPALDGGIVSAAPLAVPTYVGYFDQSIADNDDLDEVAVFQTTDLRAIDPKTGRFTMVNEDGHTLTLDRIVSVQRDYTMYMV